MDSARDYPAVGPSRGSPVLLLLLLLGILLRLTGLANHSLWIDEGCTLHVAQAPDLVEALRGDRHPPLAFLGFKLWISIFGEEDAVLRLLPALLSSGSLVLFARLARAWLDGRGALAAVGLYAVSPFAIWHGQEVRMYAFLEIFTLMTFAGAARHLASPRTGWLLLVATASALAFGSHYLGALVLPSVLAFGLVARAFGKRTTREALGPALASLAGLLAWIPWLAATASDQLRSPWRYIGKLSAREILEFPAAQVFTHVDLLGPSTVAIAHVTAAVLCLGMVLFAFRAIRRRELLPCLVLAGFLAPVAAALLFAAVLFPSFAPRYVWAAAPFTVMMMGGGLALLFRGRAGACVPALACAGCLAVTLALKRGNHRDDFRAACAEVEERWKPGDVVVVITGTPEGFSEAVVKHYLRGNEALAQSVVDGKRYLATADASLDPAATVHVIRKYVAYTEGEFQSLLAHRQPTFLGEIRQRVQYVRLGG